MLSISPTAFWVCVAKAPISVATTANPLPASPALAASMEAFKARRFVWEEISIISCVSSLIFSTASACFIATSVRCFTSAYISSVRFPAFSVVVFNWFARSITSVDSAAPLPESALILSAFSFTVAIVWFTVSVALAASSIAAASSSVVAELLLQISLTSDIFTVKSVTLSPILIPAWSINATIARSLLRICCTARAIAPVSSFIRTNFSPFSLFTKLSFAVFSIIPVKSLIGRIIEPLKKNPVIAAYKVAATIAIIIIYIKRVELLCTSLSKTAITNFMPFFNETALTIFLFPL